MTSVYVSTPDRIWYEHWLYEGIEWSKWPTAPPATLLYRRHVPFCEVFGTFLLERLEDSFLPGLFYEMFLYAEDISWRVTDVFIRSPSLYGNAGLWRQYPQDELSHWYDFESSGNYVSTFWEVLSILPAPPWLSSHFDYAVARVMYRAGAPYSFIDKYFHLRNTRYSASCN